jgi:hypothetical protein
MFVGWWLEVWGGGGWMLVLFKREQLPRGCVFLSLWFNCGEFAAIRIGSMEIRIGSMAGRLGSGREVIVAIERFFAVP